MPGWKLLLLVFVFLFEVRRLLDESGTKGVLLGADCTIPRDTDIRHLEWIRDEADKYVKEHKA